MSGNGGKLTMAKARKSGRRPPLAKVMAALAQGKTERDEPEDLVTELLAARDPNSPVKKALDEFEAAAKSTGVRHLPTKAPKRPKQK
jgi:hypothetical protein